MFGFYQFAQFEVKVKFLEVIQNYVLKLKKDLVVSLPGLMMCMLPALEDQSPELK